LVGFGGCCGEIVDGQLGEGLVEPQAQHRHRVADHLVGPVRAPAELVDGAASNGLVVGMGEQPPHADVYAAGLRQQQFQVN